MAPFMIIGRRTSIALKTPALGLVADPARCTDCGTCTDSCPMSVDVRALVGSGRIEHTECAMCGSCVDACPRKVIRFAFGRPG
jgi:heterodisulfide reductase subunit A-like polyferredoxin